MFRGKDSRAMSVSFCSKMNIVNIFSLVIFIIGLLGVAVKDRERLSDHLG